MVTGDNVKTAKAIAVECGILGSISEATEPIIIEGKTFRALTDQGREQIVDSILVESNNYNSLSDVTVWSIRLSVYLCYRLWDGHLLMTSFCLCKH